MQPMTLAVLMGSSAKGGWFSVLPPCAVPQEFGQEPENCLGGGRDHP